MTTIGRTIDKAARTTIRRVQAGTCYICALRPVDPQLRITCRPCYDIRDAETRAEVEAERAAIAAEKGAAK